MSIKERVMRVVSDQLSIDPDKLTEDTRFVADLGADSLDIVELVMALEEEFQIEFPEEKVESAETIGDVIGYIGLVMLKDD
ncbi:MAG: acyl carrier protein [Planctomycetia bacterium]|nr:acyl carrier protein [Planctomycetia bacterium]